MFVTAERQTFTVEPLSPVLGAAITGLDLREPLTEATRRALYQAFVRYQVLCFRDQQLDADQQIAFTEQFGTLERHMASNRGKVNPLVHIVSNLDADGKPSGKVASTHGHSDKSFRPQPSLATLLHALTMPPGDLLMWDNRCLLHRANSNFDAARFPRVLQRTCLRGTAPA